MRTPVTVLCLIVFITLLAPVLSSFDPLQTHPENQFLPPGSDHWLGTDSLGRDVFTRLLYGGRQTLMVAAIATAIALVPGVMLGVVAGSLRGWTDTAIMTLLNALLAVPGLVVALVVLTLVGRGLLPVALAVGFSQIAPCAYVTRSAVLVVRSMPYVDAARVLGADRSYLMLNTILPNVRASLLAYAGVIFSYAILNSAALNFLGLGGERSLPEWGVMLAEGREVFRSAPWIGFAPGLAIMVTVSAVNALADRLGRF